MSPEEFEKWREDPRLHAILNLARAVNALRFSHLAYLATKGDETPSGTRQRIQAFLLSCATMYEAFKAIDRLGKHLSDNETWQEKMTPILRDKAVKRFREKVLPLLRDKFVFHFDDDVAPEALKRLDLPEYVFAKAAGKARGDVYFALADEVALNYLLDNLPPEYGETDDEKLRAVVEEGAKLTKRLGDATESVLARGVLEMGDWELEGRPNGV